MATASAGGPAGPVGERLRPLGAPADPLRPTGRRNDQAVSPPRRRRQGETLLYLFVLLVVLVLVVGGIVLLFGVASPF